MQGPAGSYVAQDKAQSTSRDPVSNTTQKTTRTQTTYRTPDAHQLIPNVSKQQLSVVVPVVLAIALALILLSYRGAFSWHKETPKTWKDTVSEGVQNVREGVQEGLQGYYEAAKDYVADASVRGQDLAHDKLGETSEYLKNAANTAQEKVKDAAGVAQEKVKSAAELAHEQAKLHAGKASDYAYDKANEAGVKASKAYHDAHAKASDAYESATDPNLLHRASEYIHDKASALLNKGKTMSAEAQEEMVHQKNLAQENARHFAAETELKGKEKLDSFKEGANDLKRNVKSKVGL